MATIFKKQFTKPIPADATIVSRDGKPIARWIDRRGKKRTAELTAKGDRINADAKTYTAKYRDGQGKVCEVATGCTDKDATNRF